MASHNNELHLMAEQWAEWLRSRRRIPPNRLKPGTLAMLRAGPPDEPPDVVLCAALQQYDRAVRGRPDSQAKRAFLAYYRFRRPMREICTVFNRSRRTVFGWIECEREAIHIAQLRLLANHYAADSAPSVETQLRRIMRGPARSHGGINDAGIPREHPEAVEHEHHHAGR